MTINWRRSIGLLLQVFLVCTAGLGCSGRADADGVPEAGGAGGASASGGAGGASHAGASHAGSAGIAGAGGAEDPPDACAAHAERTDTFLLGDWEGDSALGLFTWSFDDGTGTRTLSFVSPGFCSDGAIRFGLEQYSSWGGGVGFEFPGCIDASGFEGITFFARANGTKKVRVHVVDQYNHSAEFGGLCESQCSGGSIDVTVTEEWSEYTIRWEELVGAAVMPLDPSAIRTIFMQVFTKQARVEETTELDIDDLALFGAAASEPQAVQCPTGASPQP